MSAIRRYVVAATTAAILCCAPQALWAQEWPQRTVKFIVPLGAGAGADIGGRLIAQGVACRGARPRCVDAPDHHAAHPHHPPCGVPAAE